MATTKFNLIITDTAQILKATRANATLDAGSYTSAMLARYANRAIREFLIEKLVTLTPFQFAEAYPEYVKESGALTLAGGVVAKPTDAIYILDVRQTTTRFSRIQQKDVESIITGINRIMVPSATKPFFWEDGGNINTLGVTSGNITARYIVVHQDISPITGSTSSGTSNSGSGTWVSSTRTLTCAMDRSFSSNDINKLIAFGGTTVGYIGIIESVTNGTTVVLRGDGLPGNFSPSKVLLSDTTPDSNDLKLNEYWHPEIVQRCVGMALADAKNTQLS